MAISADTIIEAHDVRIHFPTGTGSETIRAVDGVSFGLAAGETLGVIGESGSGKSTLARALVGLLRPTGGAIHYRGSDLLALSRAETRRWRRDVQIVFQDPHAALDPRMRVFDSVCEPLRAASAGTRTERDRQTAAALERVGIGVQMAMRYPHELSGGQKQRANIARALTLEPGVLICDEAVAALDVSVQAEILNLFAALQAEFGLAYLFITHDLAVAAHVSDRIAVMYLGCFMEIGPADALVRAPAHPYTRALLSAVPVPVPKRFRRSERIVLEGDIPSPIAPPSGCRFRTRCPRAEEICALEAPHWRRVSGDHEVACHFPAVTPAAQLAGST
jgi:peptide/nickel transport system ATP-binding protein/oligopeptide transport system ATP-binding protein